MTVKNIWDNLMIKNLSSNVLFIRKNDSYDWFQTKKVWKSQLFKRKPGFIIPFPKISFNFAKNFIMTEDKHKVISVDYTLFQDSAEGKVIESTQGRQPLVFLSGMGQMIPDFEANVVNLGVGEEFSFGVPAESAYGNRQEEAVIQLPQDMFMKDGKLADEVVIGNILQLQDKEGQMHFAKILSINEDSITVDLNHPLAGQNLHFTGTVTETREATEEEVSHGHVHGPGGHEH